MCIWWSILQVSLTTNVAAWENMRPPVSCGPRELRGHLEVSQALEESKEVVESRSVDRKGLMVGQGWCQSISWRPVRTHISVAVVSMGDAEGRKADIPSLSSRPNKSPSKHTCHPGHGAWRNPETAVFKSETTKNKTWKWLLWLDYNFHQWAECEFEVNCEKKKCKFFAVCICSLKNRTLPEHPNVCRLMRLDFTSSQGHLAAESQLTCLSVSSPVKGGSLLCSCFEIYCGDRSFNIGEVILENTQL